MFTAVHSIEEEPDSAPAASPCLRRRPSARPPQDRASPTPRSSPPDGKGCATPGPDPPGSSRSSVERLYTINSSRTPLDPHSPSPRHLAVLTHPGFVGAAPTLTDTSRLGLPPAFSRPLRRSTGAGLSPPLKQQRLTAHETSPERLRNHVPRPHQGLCVNKRRASERFLDNPGDGQTSPSRTTLPTSALVRAASRRVRAATASHGSTGGSFSPRNAPASIE